jgi:SH3-like domain-containing protein
MLADRSIAYLSSMPADHDERALQFDLRLLEPGDPVEIYVEAAHEWRRARVALGRGGIACVALSDGRTFPFESARRMGLRRVLN